MDDLGATTAAAASTSEGGVDANRAPPMSPGAAAAAAVADAADAEERARRRLEDELQCVLCHDGLFKPVTAPCGHSFCRVCLLDSCLSRAVAEAQCPVCRADVLGHSSAPVALNVNVTLWNVIQLLAPPHAEHRDAQQEEREFAQKLDELAARCKVHALQTASVAERGRFVHAHFDDDDASDDDYVDGEEEEESEDTNGLYEASTWDAPHEWEEEWDSEEEDDLAERGWAEQRRGTRARRRARRRERRYPELRVENTEDGRLRVARNVVLDTDDANEDGLQTMRVALALVEFPSLVELYTAHQECSLAVVKMEEDEEASAGFPFFMSESGDDDPLIVSTYYNHITLKVVDDGGNIVLERTRAARQGVVDFPELRLDVPAGLYTFHFSDDLYGMYLTVKTVLRELDEVSDAPCQETEEEHAGYVLDEAVENDRSRGRGRGRGHRQPHRRAWTASDEEDARLLEDDADASDDSFIVNDEEEEEEEVGNAAFSDDEEGEWEAHSDDEEADEAEARQRRERRRRRQGNPRRPGWADDIDLDAPHVQDMTGSDRSSENGSDRAAADNNRSRELIEIGSQEESDAHGGVRGDEDDDDGDDDSHQQVVTNARRRTSANRVVIESDDDDDDGDDGEDPSAGGDRVIEGEQKTDGESGHPELRSEGAAALGDSRADNGNEEEYEGDSAGADESLPDSAARDPNASNAGIHGSNEPEDADAVHPPSDSEVVRRPLKRRAANVLLSEDEEEEPDVPPVNASSKRIKTTHRTRSRNGEADAEGDAESSEDDDAKFARLHPWLDEQQDELHNAQQADAYEEEEREDAEHEYGDEPDEAQFSDDQDEENGNDGWDQDEEDDRSGGENYGNAYGEYGEDGNDGWD